MTGHLRTALVVEDNMLIAMEAEELLRDLGYENCHVCSSVSNALQVIADHPINFALLDIDLGNETSEEIASTLLARNIPFLFASGYDEFPELPKALVDIPVVGKPYTGSDVAAALAGLGL